LNCGTARAMLGAMDRWLIIVGICVIVGSILTLSFQDARYALIEGGAGVYMILKGIGGTHKEPPHA